MAGTILLKNIKKIVLASASEKPAGKNMAVLPSLEDAWLLLTNGLVSGYGLMKAISKPDQTIPQNRQEIDCSGKFVLPCWCDSHTHLVYATSRETEFVDRIKGLSYEEIANKGGGILNSAKKLNEMPEEILLQKSLERINEIIRTGTGAVEIKSGYGLSLNGELKMLRVIQKLKNRSPVTIKATFLGAHAVPEEYKINRSGYIKLIIDKMMPAIAAEGLADYIDVFCERNYFTAKETEDILEAGARYGLKPKIHVNQFSVMGGVKAGVAHKAVSVDHLEVVSDEDLEVLMESSTVPTLLPACSFFLGIPYAPARRLIDAGLPVALASDYNPGSAPSGNMNFVISLACIKMKMTPEEAINAATTNGAFAMEVNHDLGSIAVGKKANIYITHPMESLALLPCSFGINPVETVILNGEIIN